MDSNGNKGLSWLAWQEKNHLQDVRGVNLRAKLTRYAAIAVLLVTILLWSRAADYQVFVSFAVCAGAVRVAFLAAAERKYGWAVLFAGMALLYNPLLPVFALSGLLELFIVLASAAAFAVSLVALRPRVVRAAAAR